MPRIGPFSLT
jgi:hypothetical protein